MGTSLLTNQSAMNALQTLRAIGNNLDTTQRRVSTGLRINEAADDTAYWSISSMMKSDRNALSAVSSAMSLGKSQIDVAYQSTEKIKGYLDNIQKSLTTAYEKGTGDLAKIQGDVSASVTNIQAAVYSANMAEKNILANGGNTVNIAGAYRREGTSVYVDMISVGGAELNFAKPSGKGDGQYDLDQGILKSIFGTGVGSTIPATTLPSTRADAPTTFIDLDSMVAELAKRIDALNNVNTGTDKDKIGKAKNDVAQVANAFSINDFGLLTEGNFKTLGSQGVEALTKALQGKITDATSKVVTAGASLGAAQKQVEGQIDFVSKLMDAVDKGVGALVDADMNAESARLASLQVQQQLGIQALSIANQNSQNILSLFRQ